MLNSSSIDLQKQLSYDGIQSFGYLIVTDLDLNITAGSENCSDWLKRDVNTLFDRPFSFLIDHYFHDYQIDIQEAVRQIIAEENDRNLLEIRLLERGCYLSVYRNEHSVYFEFEIKVADLQVYFPKFESFAQVLMENTKGIWQHLSDYMGKVLGYDRITVYQFIEGGYGKIIAETRNNDNLESIIGLYQSDFAVLAQARKVHLKNLCRLTHDIYEEPIRIVSKDGSQIDLLSTNIRTLAKVHSDHLKKVGIGCNLSFSILIDDQIWGLIFCQNVRPTRINLIKREAFVYMIQWASTRFADEQLVQEREFNERIRNFELLLKEKLLLKKDMLAVLGSLSKLLCQFANADAMVIASGDQIYAHQISIGREKLKQLKGLILRETDQYIYTDEEFTWKFGEELGIGMSRFAGIAKVDIESNRQFTLYFFRKETIVKRTYMDTPTRHLMNPKPNEIFTTEPHKHFDVWHHTIEGTSERWTERDLYYFSRLRKLIKTSMNQMSLELSSLNEEVVSLNRALDSYAYTVSHDVKNPLSAINLSVQMLLQRPDMPLDLRNRMLQNMKSAVDIIGELLVAIHLFSKIKSFSYQTELVDVSSSIDQITTFCKMRYDADSTQIKIGELLPVYGHKTLVYQLFQNLIGNAIKYSARAEHPAVEIYAEKGSEFIRYFIRDNGIGIADEDLKSIFDTFKRLDNAIDFEGTGLGLTIVKTIADKLDLQIKVDSKIGMGTEFQVLFPIEQ